MENNEIERGARKDGNQLVRDGGIETRIQPNNTPLALTWSPLGHKPMKWKSRGLIGRHGHTMGAVSDGNCLFGAFEGMSGEKRRHVPQYAFWK